MAVRKANPPFLNGVPEMLILRLLLQRAMHGYELIQAIKLASGDELEFGEGCVYPILHRLQAQGLLQSAEVRTSGRLRVVYRVTPRGKSQLAQSIGTWREIVSAVDQVLQGGQGGSTVMA